MARGRFERGNMVEGRRDVKSRGRKPRGEPAPGDPLERLAEKIYAATRAWLQRVMAGLVG